MKIYNIIQGTFNNYGIRAGDLIAIINFVQWLRKDEDNPSIKLYLRPGVLVNETHVQEFFKFLCELTDCFSLEEGYETLNYNQVMLWDFRSITGDVVEIHNRKHMKRKIVIFPVYDSQYHTERNWGLKLLESLLKYYSKNSIYSEYEKLVCAKDVPDIDIVMGDFSLSTNFLNNVNHIQEAEIFIGGDTWSSHFASALDPAPKQLIYYYSARSAIHTLPFHLLSANKGKLRTFWQNCYKTTYKGNLIL